MKQLIKQIESIKGTKIKNIIDMRLMEFKSLGKKSNNDLFKELCFCILTANYSAEGGIRIQKAVGNGFLNLSEKQLAKKLKDLGYRFPNKRANYIVEARKHKDALKDVLKNLKGNELRNWIAGNIKGLGYKEASHFLRNIGFGDYAIIDFHIVDLLESHRLIKQPKTLTKNKYLEIERILDMVAKTSKMNQAKLDLYLWYLETGKVLK
jgi:N-glycosylase/DNA lyase